MKVDWLQRDLHLLALPYGSGGGEGFALDIRPSDAKTVELVTNALPSHHYRQWRLSAAFRDYLQSALWFLVEGELLLEITYFYEPARLDGPPVAFVLDFLYPEMVRDRFGRRSYLVPEGDPWEEPARLVRKKIDGARLVVGSLPRRMRRDLDRTLELLEASDEDMSVMTAFTTGRYGSNSGFDFSHYQREVHDAVLAGSRPVGWSGRGSFTDGLLDPEKAWRAIQFSRFVVRVRDVAIATLQAALNRAGSEIGFSAELALTGVLTSDDLDADEAALADGSRPIADLLVPKPRATD